MKIYRLRLRLRLRLQSKLPTPPDSDSDSAALVEELVTVAPRTFCDQFINSQRTGEDCSFV